MQRQPSEHVSVPMKWNCHPPNATVDLELLARVLVQEHAQQEREMLMAEKLPEVGCVHLHSTGRRMKLGQGRRLKDWQTEEGMTGMHCEVEIQARGEIQAYLEDWVGWLSLLLR